MLALTFFIRSLEIALFPIDESMAYAFARKERVFWLLLFSFYLGFATTVAETALIAVAQEVANIAAVGGMIEHTDVVMNSHVTGWRCTVAVSAAFAILIAVLRILKA